MIYLERNVWYALATSVLLSSNSKKPLSYDIIFPAGTYLSRVRSVVI